MSQISQSKPTDSGAEFASMALMRKWGERKSKGATVAERKEMEKPPVALTDGRRARRTGRDVQMNVKMKPEFREDLFALAEARGIGVAELIERIVCEWKSLGGTADQSVTE